METKKVEQKYDVALSFASEERYYVEEVLEILRNSSIKVFYDKFEEADLWGKDLYTYLQKIYRYQAKHTIKFCSKHYVKKLWTNHERKREINFFYIHDVIDSELKNSSEWVLKFSPPFVQIRLSMFFTNELFKYPDHVLEPP